MLRVLHDIPPWSHAVSMPTATTVARPGKRPGQLSHPVGMQALHAAITPLPPTEPTGTAGIGGRAALPIAFLVGLLTGPAAHAQQAASSRQQVAMTVEEITAEANARSAAGMSAAEVDAWIQQAMDQAGLSVSEPPESWDVYGQARWNREAATRVQTARLPDDTQAQPVPQRDDRVLDHNVYQQPGLGTPHAAGPEQGIRNTGTTDVGKAPLQGSRPQD